MLSDERDRILGEWLERHKGVFFKVIHAYAATQAEREDLFQEIALQVWRSVDAFRGDAAVTTWIYRVALNTAIAWTRKRTGIAEVGSRWKRRGCSRRRTCATLDSGGCTARYAR